MSAEGTLQQLLAAALRQPPGPARDAWIAEQCGADASLHRELLDQIALNEATRSFEEQPDAAADPTETGGPPSSAEGPGTVIGPYQLLELLGEGGYGAVYRAQQSAPVRREVALKIIKLGMDTRRVIARFEAERQVLAMMDHPNIARVFDAGATDSGRPYFVMELVRGERITNYCDRERLSIRERLGLFCDVCRAVQHAHQKGIIHRDLKPGNILVRRPTAGAHAQPKVIDFGIAKATQERITEHTITEARRVVGTPAYMSPEQAGVGEPDVDTRSDIYSLGVVLYELLSGTTPVDHQALRGASQADTQRLLFVDDPPRPSARVSTPNDPSTSAPRDRGTDASGLARSLRGDLDWIVMRCLEKDPARRYATALELVADIERHLADQPVLAGPPSKLYLIRKYVRRHRVFVTTAAVIAVVLVIETVISFRAAREAQANLAVANLAREAEREQTALAEESARTARIEAAKARQIADFAGEMLTGVDPSIASDLDTTLMKMILDSAARDVDVQLSGQPEVEASLRLLMGRTYGTIAEYTESEQQLEAAVELTRRELGDEHVETLAAVAALGRLRIDQGRFDESDRLVREALAGRRRLLGEEHPDTVQSMNDLGALLFVSGKWEQAETQLREALALHRRTHDAPTAQTWRIVGNLVAALADLYQLEEAETLQREMIAELRDATGDDHAALLQPEQTLAHLLLRQGKYPEAETRFRHARDEARRLVGEEHPLTFSATLGLGQVLHDLERFGEAEAEYRGILPTMTRVLGEDHPKRLSCLSNLGLTLAAQGRLDESESVSREALERLRRTQGEDHPSTLGSLNNLAHLMFAQRRLEDAEPLLRATLASYRRTLGDDHVTTLLCLNNLAAVLRDLGRLGEAEPLQREAWEGLRAALGDEHESTVALAFNLGQVLELQGRLEEAEGLFRQVFDVNRATLGPDHVHTLSAYNGLASVLRRLGRAEEAERLRRELLEAADG